MKLITKAIEAKLEKAGYYGKTAIMKLFNPYGGQTWIVTGRDPDEPDMLYGVVDLGMGCVEAGPFYLPELLEAQSPFRFKLERDMYFNGGQTIEELLVRETLSGL